MKNPATCHLRLPERHKTKELYDQQLPLYSAAMQQLAQDLRLILEQQGLTPAIKYRVKGFAAYFEKLRKNSAASNTTHTITGKELFARRKWAAIKSMLITTGVN